MSLEPELAFYRTERTRLLAGHRGKFALIRDHHLVGLFDTFVEAFEAGFETARHDPGAHVGERPLLVHEISAGDANPVGIRSE